MKRTRLVALPLADRTATTASPQMTEDCATGIIIYLNVTVASGTGGLTVQLRGFDAEGNPVVFFAATAAVTTTGRRCYIIQPGTLGTAAQGITQVLSAPLPQLFDINVVAGNSTTYRYSVLAEIF